MRSTVLFYITLIIILSSQRMSAQNGFSSRKINFAGQQWNIKTSQTGVGPGNNIFSDDEDMVWVDSMGQLHLSIKKKDENYYCSEIVSQNNFGYGAYIFYLNTDVSLMAKNSLLGFFTWNPQTLEAKANNEIDIEFTRYHNTHLRNIMHYTVQPSEGFGEQYPERTHFPDVDPSMYEHPTIHLFIWTRQSINWFSFQGTSLNRAQLFAHWKFVELENPLRPVFVNHEIRSQKVGVPREHLGTEVRMNFWIFRNKNGLLEQEKDEVVISNFEFIPLRKLKKSLPPALDQLKNHLDF